MTDDEYKKLIDSILFSGPYSRFFHGSRNQGKSEYICNVLFEKSLHNRPFSPIFNKEQTSRLKESVIYAETKTGKIVYADAADPIYAKLQSEKDKNRPIIIELVCTKDLETDEIVYITEIEFQYNPRMLKMVIHK